MLFGLWSQMLKVWNFYVKALNIHAIFVHPDPGPNYQELELDNYISTQQTPSLPLPSTVTIWKWSHFALSILKQFHEDKSNKS